MYFELKAYWILSTGKIQLENILDNFLYAEFLSFIVAENACNSLTTVGRRDFSNSAAFVKSAIASSSFHAPMCAFPLLYKALTLSV